MISRRLLRVKAFQSVYSFFINKGRSIQSVEKELIFSIDKFYDLYFYLLLIPVDVKKYASSVIEQKKLKRQATFDDLNPNLKFIENDIINYIETNETFTNQINSTKISWNKYPSLIKDIYTQLIDTEWYINYMNSPVKSFKEDKDFMSLFYSGFLFNFEDLYETLEEQSIFWNNDVDFLIDTIASTVSNSEENNKHSFQIHELFKKEEDRDFVLTLFRKTIINHKEYLKYIDDQVTNWDVDRIAETDKLIIILGISEIVEFSSIPLKVSFNEYIELGKTFGSEKSGSFINGVLEIITEQLKKDNKVNKIGRGLV